MTDVEELLRQTLTDPRHKVDPGVGLYETVQSRARGRRHRRTAIGVAAVAVVAVVAVGSALGVESPRHRVSPVNVPTPTRLSTPTPTPPSTPTGKAPTGEVGAALSLGAAAGTVVQAAVTTDAVYVLATNPSRVIVVSPTDGRIKKTVAGPAGNPTGLAVGDGRVLAWSQNTGSVRAYDEHAMTLLGDFETGFQIFNAVSTDGEIYLATDRGLMRSNNRGTDSATLQPPTTRVADVPSAYALAADPQRHRVLVDNAGHIDAVDTTTYAVTEGANLGYVKASIAVVGDDLWVAGYVSGDHPRLVRLDASTLQVVAHGDPEFDLGPGAEIWPGQNVLWVSGGTSSVSCVDPTSGAVYEQWGLSVAGPVGSVGGIAYGINTMSGVVPLTMRDGCTG